MTDQTQSRVPPGVTSGGEYATARLEETDPMKLYDRGTGTCFNPPMSTTAEHAIRFWESVDIPDITIQRGKALYNAQQQVDFSAHVDAHVAAWRQQYFAKNPAPRMGDARQARWAEQLRVDQAAAEQQIVDEQHPLFFHDENPEVLNNVDAQQVVRAWFTGAHGPNPGKFPEEFEKLKQHKVELFDGTASIIELSERFRMKRFRDVLTQVPDPATDAINSMHDVLAGILQSMSVDMNKTANAVETNEY
jgi:hypothetical protein